MWVAPPSLIAACITYVEPNSVSPRVVNCPAGLAEGKTKMGRSILDSTFRPSKWLHQLWSQRPTTTGLLPKHFLVSLRIPLRFNFNLNSDWFDRLHSPKAFCGRESDSTALARLSQVLFQSSDTERCRICGHACISPCVGDVYHRSDCQSYRGKRKMCRKVLAKR